MKISDTGRNDPCPCGSGKKFKKCCMNNPEKLQNVSVFKKVLCLPRIQEIDYGDPSIDDVFLDSQNVHELSAQRFLYSTLLMPEIEEFVSTALDDKIVRSRDERYQIQNTRSATGLINIMKNDPDVVNHTILIRKILELQDVTIPIILNEFKKPQNTNFYELAIRIIKSANKPYTDQIIDIIENHQRNAYAVSILTILLGFYNEKHKSNSLLWNLYHYFKEYYPNETFSDGPLVALLEQRAQDREFIENTLQKNSGDW
ncbi:MAG: SEC-C domain-containing protein [Tissierellales bacterium]|nr:SEC-C domain-containing protein [Tissierellales bacterium]